MVDLARQAPAGMTATTAPSSRRYYVLGLLTTVYALNFLDRTIFNVLIEPIKKEFSLSDTEIGLLAGFGFVLFYSTLGIPIACAADRLNRRNIVATALAFWSDLWRRRRALFAAVGRRHDDAGRVVVRLGGGVCPHRHKAGKLDKLARATGA
jgi:MFS family permease